MDERLTARISDVGIHGQIVTLETEDGLALKGYLATANNSTATVIHIHGSCGNFYENAFIATMARLYTARGVNFLSFNNRGHDCIAEAYQNGRMEHVLAAPTRI